MNDTKLSTIGLLIFTSFVWAQTAPSVAELNRLPAYENAVELRITTETKEISRLGPLLVRVAFVNKGESPITIETRESGAPLALASLVATGTRAFERHDQWLMRSSPEHRDRRAYSTLLPGDSAAGSFLIFLGNDASGAQFANAGSYRIRLECQPDASYAPIYSNEITLRVSTEDGGSEALLDALGELAVMYYSYDRETLKRNGMTISQAGMEIIKHVVSQDQPLLVAPEERPQDQREADLVESLEIVLRRHPDSPYSGYLARFLGLVQFKTFEHEISIADWKILTETGERPERTTQTLVMHPAYEKARRYLTVAKDADLWPRTTAAEHLGRLYVMSQEWDKAEDVVAQLKAQFASPSGEGPGVRLEREMADFKEKLSREKSRRTGP